MLGRFGVLEIIIVFLPAFVLYFIIKLAVKHAIKELKSVISSIERGLEDLENMKIRVQNEPGRNYIRQDVSMLEYVDYGVATVAKNKKMEQILSAPFFYFFIFFFWALRFKFTHKIFKKCNKNF